VRAIESFPDAGTILHAESWLFRIAHRFSAARRSSQRHPIRRRSGASHRPHERRGCPSVRDRQPADVHATPGGAAQLRHSDERCRPTRSARS
jgi:hypothetical protein